MEDGEQGEEVQGLLLPGGAGGAEGGPWKHPWEQEQEQEQRQEQWKKPGTENGVHALSEAEGHRQEEGGA